MARCWQCTHGGLGCLPAAAAERVCHVRVPSGPAAARLPRRTRRTWKPNSHNKRLYSHILARMVPLRVTAAALRCGGHAHKGGSPLPLVAGVSP